MTDPPKKTFVSQMQKLTGQKKSKINIWRKNAQVFFDIMFYTSILE